MTLILQLIFYYAAPLGIAILATLRMYTGQRPASMWSAAAFLVLGLGGVLILNGIVTGSNAYIIYVLAIILQVISGFQRGYGSRWIDYALAITMLAAGASALMLQ